MKPVHLTIDLYGCDKDFLSSEDKIRSFLTEMVSGIGMQAISEPLVVSYDHPDNPDRAGVTGVIILAESNITIHGFSEKGFAMVDINSCEDFDVELAVGVVVEKLKPERFEKKVLERGREIQE